MIALSSCIGKMCNGCVGNRTLRYLKQNGILDSSVQKSFTPGVSGCIDHSWAITDLIQSARSERRTLHLTFLDFSDAFGSVCHNFLPVLFEKYRLPKQISGYILSLYSKLRGKAISSKWETNEFRLKTGVFQGDPLSVMIFLMYVQPILTYLQENFERNSFNGEIVRAFADDICLIQKDKRDMQEMIEQTHFFSRMLGLSLNASKCFHLSISSGTTKVYPKKNCFKIPTCDWEVWKTRDRSKFQYEDLSPISANFEKAFEYLGMPITANSIRSMRFSQFQIVQKRLENSLENIEKTPIRNEYKLQIFVKYLLPSFRYILSVCDIRLCHVKKLDFMADQFLRKWLKVPKSTTNAFFRHPDGLNIPTFESLIKHAKIGAIATILLRGSENDRNSLERKKTRESDKIQKSLVCEENLIPKTQELIDELEEKSFVPLKTRIDKITKKAKNEIRESDSKKFYEKLNSLQVQGRFSDILDGPDIDLKRFQEFIWKLPKGYLSFVVNSVCCTLSVASNLKRWSYKRLGKNSRCGHYETVLHCLAGCENSLDRFTWRHDSVLDKIRENFAKFLEVREGLKIFADLPGHLEAENPKSTLPQQLLDIYPSSRRPDIVIWDTIAKKVLIFELTVPFESNFVVQHDRKTERYDGKNSLVDEIKRHQNKCWLICFEVGVTGILTKGNRQRLRDCFIKLDWRISRSEFKRLCHDVCRVAVACSRKIFYCRNESWNANTKFLK